MATKLRQKKIKKRIYSWWTVGILAVVALLFLSNTWDVYKKYVASKKNVAGLETRYVESKERQVELKDKIESLKSEDGLEAEIREKFNVAKEGEKVLVIINEETPEELPEEEEVGLLKGFWEDVLNIFR